MADTIDAIIKNINISCRVSNDVGTVISNTVTLKVVSQILISSNTNNFVLYDELIKIGWDKVSPVNLNMTVDGNVIVGSDSTASPAFKVDALPTGSIINLLNYGIITGRGGDGGNQTSKGDDGGNGMSISYPINIDNREIIGGGGGGGGGGGIRGTPSGLPQQNGFSNGNGGAGFGGSRRAGFTNDNTGAGGNIGEKGNVGVGFFSVGNGGSAGDAIIGNSFVNWIKRGDVRGGIK